MKTVQSEDRILDWNNLRNQVQTLDLDEALHKVNQWWLLQPFNNYYLHWDDVKTWPNPWDLVGDGILCDLSKALGIVYTLMLLERTDIENIEFAETSDGDNLVLVNQGKYVLNWSLDNLVSIQTLPVDIARTMSANEVAHNIN